MNVLFVLYGGFDTNSAIPLALHARELQRRRHRCAVAMPSGARPPSASESICALTYDHALADPQAIFDDGQPADVLHAWTPREGVRRFVTQYQSKRPTPWVAYLEDNEAWIAQAALSGVGIPADRLLEHTEEVISTWTPDGLPHPLRYRAFVGLADAAAVIQDKLAVDVPPWVPCATVMPGVDLELFAPRPPDTKLREHFEIKPDERVVVYPGGLNDFTRPGLESLALAIGMVNESGVRCRLLRSGPVPLDFLRTLPTRAAQATTDAGVLERDAMPAFLSLADVFVQPGKHSPFEDLRLPGKLPELFAMGRPVVMPDTNIAHLLRDGMDAVILRTGKPEEMAQKCLELFADGSRAAAIGAAGRRFAEANFDPARQAQRLERVYQSAIAGFDRDGAAAIWSGDALESPVRALARRLRRLAQLASARDIDVTSLLEEHADYLESALARDKGLEAGIKVRDAYTRPLRDKIAKLEREVQDYGTAAHEFRTHLIESRQEVERLKSELQTLKAELGALRASASWRATAPLRSLAAIISGLSARKRS